MSERFDGVLVPEYSSAIVEAFQNFRPQVPMQLAQFEQRLTGVTRYKSGPYQADYEQLARRFSSLSQAAVIVYFCDEGGGTI